jgi:hypothetical protein
VNSDYMKAAALALVAGGILLTVFGVSSMNSTTSDLSRILTGAPTDRAIWMLTGGVVMLVAGIVALLPIFGRK